MITILEQAAFNPKKKLGLLKHKAYSNLEVTKILNSNRKFKNDNDDVSMGVQAEASVKFIKLPK
jgi:hypothetical protein